MDIVWGLFGFIVGCIVWNYASTPIKTFLHIQEKAVGDKIKSEVTNLKSKL